MTDTTADLSRGAGAQEASPAPAGLLRVLTCGSVDDGKSTLIGRLLYDSRLLLEDQLHALKADSRRKHAGEEIDFSLLLDGLEAEREQGITIDVAYRFFATPRRKFIVADTPGHEQYTRNMATGASTADVAILLVDARNGIRTQTRRHALLASMLGIRHVVLAVNKMDLVDYRQARFAEIAAEFSAYAERLAFASVMPIPMSASLGENVAVRGASMAWYTGPHLLAHLESLDVETNRRALPFRLPVQWINRPDADFRGYSGTLAGGTVRPGDSVVVAGSGRRSTVARIVTLDGDRDAAGAGDAVTVTLTDEIDISRGDVLAAPEERPEVADQFAAHVIWMADTPLYPSRSYLLKIGTRTVNASVSEIKHLLDVNSGEHLAAKELHLNDIGFCNLSLAAPVAFDPYRDNRETGGFILIDRLTHATVGAGLIAFGLRRATNIHWQALAIDKAAHAAQKGQKPAILWFTGLSGAGKSTIANLLEKKLHLMGRHTYTLDGDNVRHGLNRDLGFTDADRVENIRRVAETAKLFVEAGLIVLVSFISPFRAERRMARELVAKDEFVEIFVDTPLEECLRRDPKGLYRKAKVGELKNFTGIDSPYEPPEHPEIRLDTIASAPEDLVDAIIAELRARNVVG